MSNAIYRILRRDLLLRGVLSLSLLLALLALMVGNGSATVVGDCQVCHSRFPEMMEEAPPGGPQQFARRNQICVNCHTGTGSDSVKMLGGAKVPVVQGASGEFLAGGSFHYVSRPFGDRKGHNVDGVASTDAKYAGAPPGYSRESDPSTVGYDPKKPLSCSGSNGCHGDRNIADPLNAILGTHHAPDTPVDGSTTAKSFRYLKNTKKVNGVVGFEDEDWENTRSSKDHNEYTITLNSFCSSCHSRHHGQVDDESPWFRHPVGEVIPAKGEYAKYTKYSFDAPVGRPKVEMSSSAKVEPGRDRIVCLSCHLAHAGPHDAGLRWDYEAMITGLAGKGGCFTCHTSKAD